MEKEQRTKTQEAQQLARFRVRRSEERGHANHGWLDSRHSFSFASYYDPQHMGFRSLRVINEDQVQGAKGFGAHPHQNMEILTLVLEGALEHRDDMGTRSILAAGGLQRISAGSGIVHSEMNASLDEAVHFLQIWIEPSSMDLRPSYQETQLASLESHKGLRLVAEPDGRGGNGGSQGSMKIHQDARIYHASLDAGQDMELNVDADRGIWIQVINGDVQVSGYALGAGDAVAIEGVEFLPIRALSAAEFLLFDLA